VQSQELERNNGEDEAREGARPLVLAVHGRSQHRQWNICFRR
jgi:hypothetical protein